MSWEKFHLQFIFQQRNFSMVIGKQAEERKKKMTKVVKRLVFLMLGYAVINALTFIPISIMQQHSKQLEYYINQYFSCLMFSRPDHCPKSKYQWKKNWFIILISSS